MTGVSRAPRNIAHRIIEEFMLAANEAVAAHLEATGLPSIYRIHEQPDPKRVMEFEEVAAHFGYSLGVGAIPVKKFAYADKRRDGQKLRREIVLPAEVKISLAPVSEAGGQDRRQARRAHPQLSDAALAQAGALQRRTTRPLRAGRRHLHALHFAHPPLSGSDRASAAAPPFSMARLIPRRLSLSAVADECFVNRTPRRRSRARAGGVEEGQVHGGPRRRGVRRASSSARRNTDCLWNWTDLFVEGLVPIDTLPGDRYTYHENVRKIIGQRTRREFSIGDRVRVILDRVDPVERKLQFSIVEPERSGKGHPKRKANRR